MYFDKIMNIAMLEEREDIVEWLITECHVKSKVNELYSPKMNKFVKELLSSHSPRK